MYDSQDIERLIKAHYEKTGVFYTDQLIRAQRNYIDMLDGDLAQVVIEYLNKNK